MYDRRAFISFLGKASIGAAILPPFLAGCGSTTTPSETLVSEDDPKRLREVLLESISPSNQDDLLLTKGLNYHKIIKWGDSISDIDSFGFNNDFTCFIPFDEKSPNDGLLWVNHEYIDPLFVSDFNRRDYDDPEKYRTKEQVDKEMYAVGGSIVRIKEENGKWRLMKNDPHNRRITGHTPIPINWDSPIKGETAIMGTNSNCSGGITPWKTFLTCEENYDYCFGETTYDSNNTPTKVPSIYGWENFYNAPSEHYGWVVEVDHKSGSAQKHIALGRFAHEFCTNYDLEDK